MFKSKSTIMILMVSDIKNSCDDKGDRTIMILQSKAEVVLRSSLVGVAAVVVQPLFRPFPSSVARPLF